MKAHGTSTFQHKCNHSRGKTGRPFHRNAGGRLSVERLEDRSLLAAVGIPNNAFGEAGTATVGFFSDPHSDDRGLDTEILADGKMLVLTEDALIRYSVDGSADPSFGNYGFSLFVFWLGGLRFRVGCRWLSFFLIQSLPAHVCILGRELKNSKSLVELILGWIQDWQ